MITTAITRAGRGVLLRARDGGGRVGVGEASPLPGRSPDDVERCAAVLEALELDDGAIDGGAAAVLAIAKDAAGGVAAARFAIETALLDLLGQRRGVAISALLAPERTRRPVPLNALCTSVGDAARAAARGIRCVKLKAPEGARASAALALARAVRAELGDRVAIRVDAQGAWNAQTAARHLAALAELGVEYVEDPVASGDVAVDANGPPCAIAIDEHLAAGDVLASATIAVVKPTVLGGFARSIELAAGRDPVVTHAFEGPVALAAAAELALAMGCERACGLDLHAGLAAWPTVTIPQLGDAEIVTCDVAGLGVRL